MFPRCGSMNLQRGTNIVKSNGFRADIGCIEAVYIDNNTNIRYFKRGLTQNNGFYKVNGYKRRKT